MHVKAQPGDIVLSNRKGGNNQESSMAAGSRGFHWLAEIDDVIAVTRQDNAILNLPAWTSRQPGVKQCSCYYGCGSARLAPGGHGRYYILTFKPGRIQELAPRILGGDDVTSQARSAKKAFLSNERLPPELSARLLRIAEERTLARGLAWVLGPDRDGGGDEEDDEDDDDARR